MSETRPLNQKVTVRASSAGEFSLIDFLEESNMIEGIFGKPEAGLVAEATTFLSRDQLRIADVSNFVWAAAGAPLRDKPGMNVRVGAHVPPQGGPEMPAALDEILEKANADRGNAVRAYAVHHQYETLHPFMDGNGRSGRLLWLWVMGGIGDAPLGFLHHWYYQSLQFVRA